MQQEPSNKERKWVAAALGNIQDEGQASLAKARMNGLSLVCLYDNVSPPPFIRHLLLALASNGISTGFSNFPLKIFSKCRQFARKKHL